MSVKQSYRKLADSQTQLHSISSIMALIGVFEALAKNSSSYLYVTASLKPPFVMRA